MSRNMDPELEESFAHIRWFLLSVSFASGYCSSTSVGRNLEFSHHPSCCLDCLLANYISRLFSFNFAIRIFVSRYEKFLENHLRSRSCRIQESSSSQEIRYFRTLIGSECSAILRIVRKSPKAVYSFIELSKGLLIGILARLWS